MNIVNKIRSEEEYYREACEKNALRRTHKLPLLDIKVEIEKLRRTDYLKLYGEVVDLHKDVYWRMRDEFLAEKRKDNPRFGYSYSVRWIIALMVGPRYEAYLTSLGYPPPPPPPGKMCTYGEARAETLQEEGEGGVGDRISEL
jgi:hypothetical protein